MTSEEDWENLLASAAEDRIRYLQSDCWLDIPASLQVLGELEDLVAQPTKRRPHCMLLIAESGMGKTMILDELLRRHPAGRNRDTGDLHVTAVYSEMPSPGDVVLLLQEVLRQAGCPTRYRRVNELKAYFEQQLKRLQVQIIVVDEVQRIALEHPRLARQLCECLKWISTTLQVPLVAAGTHEAVQYFESDSQLARRFRRRELKPLQLNADFQKLVCSILAFMPLRKGFDERIYTDPNALAQILTAAESCTDGIFDHIRSLTVAALKRNKEYLHYEDVVGSANGDG